MASFKTSDMVPFADEPRVREHRAAPAAPATAPLARAPGDDPMRLLRSAPNVRDKSLSTLTQAWRDRLPADQKPTLLCERYPRVANRLALCWGDATLCAMVFKELLGDRRGGRAGFPVDVQKELLALCDAAAGGHVAALANRLS